MNYDKINKAMRIYLGGDEISPGVMPISMTERLRENYPNNWEQLKKDLEAIIERMMTFEVDWSNNTLVTGASNVKEYLKAEYPWLELTTIEKLANYFAYKWK